MHSTWKPWPQLGNTPTASPSAKSTRQTAQSVENPDPVEKASVGRCSDGGKAPFSAEGLSDSEAEAWVGSCRMRRRRSRMWRMTAPMAKPKERTQVRPAKEIAMFFTKSDAPSNGPHADGGGAAVVSIKGYQSGFGGEERKP
ncbi:hypothetical protein HPP92_005024 [Vanilla planifolia]|uniref:Uncharacterized protein n=1 Tax=Vanilla planifolia TaxID=51239 RepID=A0A835RKL2_VANPL|nr:hypothetical protein HPP92_005024 [Vanilla planifolia]